VSILKIQRQNVWQLHSVAIGNLLY
jgi:hypothetical protein